MLIWRILKSAHLDLRLQPAPSTEFVECPCAVCIYLRANSIALQSTAFVCNSFSLGFASGQVPKWNHS
jgi:hypothetical protein